MNKDQFDIDYLRKYVNGELSASEMYKIERATHEDEMLIDIILGLEYEIKNKLSPPKEILNHRIFERKPTTVIKVKKRFSYATLSIAASLIAILSIGILFYYYQHSDKEEEKMLSIPIAEKKIETSRNIPFTQDSLIDDISTNHDKLIAQIEPKTKSKIKNSDVIREELFLPAIPSTRNIELSKKIESIEISSTPNEEILIVYNLNHNNDNYATNKQEALLAEAKDMKVATMQTPSQQRAKMSNMNLDPQSQKILNDVLDRQSREEIITKGIESAEQNRSKIVDSSVNNAYANRINKSAAIRSDKKANNTNPVESVSALNNNKESTPKKGLKNYRAKLIAELNKATSDTFYFKIQFKIGNNGIPTNIQFLKSSDPTLEDQITKYLRNDEKWNVGQDNKDVILEIKK